MAKQHPLYHIALEFMDLFPTSKRFGRQANERQLQKVMEEQGWDAPELLWRIRYWSKTRNKLEPWQLVKPIPKSPIEAEKKPEPKPPKVLPPIPEAWRRRALWIYAPYETDDI